MEADLRRIFEPFGAIAELVVLRDKNTLYHRGCAFLTYYNKSSADAAINELHQKISLHNRPIVVRYAGTENQPYECKLFVGMLSKTTDISLCSFVSICCFNAKPEKWKQQNKRTKKHK